MGFMRRGSGRDYYPYVSGILGTLGTVGGWIGGKCAENAKCAKGVEFTLTVRVK